MSGTERVLAIIEELRKTFNMEDPSQITKYIGCMRHICKKDAHGECITEIKADMKQYFRSA
eukprot:2214428-Heterocapsa_arctica.AAC.1